MARILVIEDDTNSRCILREILEGGGHEVSEGNNGKEGMALSQTHYPDVVVVDIFMPEKDGLETIMELQRTLPEVKIIAMSGRQRKGEIDVLHMAKKLGAGRTLVKPFEAGTLLDAVSQVLRVYPGGHWAQGMTRNPSVGPNCVVTSSAGRVDSSVCRSASRGSFSWGGDDLGKGIWRFLRAEDFEIRVGRFREWRCRQRFRSQ